MKRKFAGIAALGMALTLAFGMTVSAADSPDASKIEDAVVEQPNTVEYDQAKVNEVQEKTTATVGNQTITDETGTFVIEDGKLTITDANGKELVAAVEMKIETFAATEEEVKTVNETIQTQAALNEVKDKVKNSSEIKQAFATELQKKTTKVQINVLTPVSLEPDAATKAAIKAAAELGRAVPVAVAHPDVVDDRYYLIMHIKENGEVEYLGPAQCVNGSVTVGFTSLSPVVPIEVTLVGEDVAGEPETPAEPTPNPNPGDSHWEGGADHVPATTESGAPASPQTGEVLPIAGFMAVICLAGAVVCVKKARN